MVTATLDAPAAMVRTQTATLAIDSRCALGEGIVWCEREARLYWVDIEGARLWSHRPALGQTQSWKVPDRIGCIGLGEDGRLLLVLAKGLYVADLRDGDDAPQLTLLVELETALGSQTRSNDGRADRSGNLVFGTKSEREDGARIGSFYQYSARHGLRRLDLPGCAIPNSICFSPDGGTLYFCDTVDARIQACRYVPDTATVSDIRIFVEMDIEGASPDGSIIDAQGHLWSAQWGVGRVVRYTPAGGIDTIVRVPARQPSCCVIGGDAGDELFITSARVDLSARDLDEQPGSGGVYVARLATRLALADGRVTLP